MLVGCCSRWLPAALSDSIVAVRFNLMSSSAPRCVMAKICCADVIPNVCGRERIPVRLSSFVGYERLGQSYPMSKQCVDEVTFPSNMHSSPLALFVDRETLAAYGANIFGPIADARRRDPEQKQYARVLHLSSTDTGSLPAFRATRVLKLRPAIYPNDTARSAHSSAIHAEPK
jgi:hypothetical protein